MSNQRQHARPQVTTRMAAAVLGAWLSLAADHPARRFARRSAIGSLVLGMLGQVAYHLLAAAHAARAPGPWWSWWPVSRS